MTILVTGATGYIGSRVVIQLAQRNLEASEADNASEETQATLAMYIGELYIWQEDGEVVEPEVKIS